ncbi:hypothetical protein HY837_03035 [archaeon]|nr:hypothetical protein [archaeon]
MKKILSIAVIIILVVNIALFSLGKISPLLFWIIIIICAANAYFVIPKLK